LLLEEVAVQLIVLVTSRLLEAREEHSGRVADGLLRRVRQAVEDLAPHQEATGHIADGKVVEVSLVPGPLESQHHRRHRDEPVDPMLGVRLLGVGDGSAQRWIPIAVRKLALMASTFQVQRRVFRRSARFRMGVRVSSRFDAEAATPRSTIPSCANSSS